MSKSNPKQLRLALVHDDFMQWGGAERCLAALAELWPQAPVYTSMVNEAVVAKTGIKRSRFVTSGLNRVPLKNKLNKPIFPIYPMFFESFDFSGYDLVISTSTRFAHCVITKPGTIHIAYMHSPFRGFWEPDLYFGKSFSGKLKHTLLEPVLSKLRSWDYTAGQRPDIMYANSRTSRDRVRKYYRREAEVIYPFVDFARFDTDKEPAFKLPQEYYVLITRLVDWKKVDVAVNAFSRLSKHLYVVGKGPDKPRLQAMAGSTVHFPGFVSDSELSFMVKNSCGVIHPQKEDFGMTVIEANYCEVPVIAYRDGGATETVIEGQTGLFFDEQTPESLMTAVSNLSKIRFSGSKLKKHAEQFSKDAFCQNWQNAVRQAFKVNSK